VLSPRLPSTSKRISVVCPHWRWDSLPDGAALRVAECWNCDSGPGPAGHLGPPTGGFDRSGTPPASTDGLLIKPAAWPAGTACSPGHIPSEDTRVEVGQAVGHRRAGRRQPDRRPGRPLSQSGWGSDHPDSRCPIVRWGATFKAACLHALTISAPVFPNSTSWGSLVRAQYRPFDPARLSGIRMVERVRCVGSAGNARMVRSPVRPRF
jgi:hypothetical protein